jgi:hypothetical protein
MSAVKRKRLALVSQKLSTEYIKNIRYTFINIPQITQLCDDLEAARKEIESLKNRYEYKGRADV